MADTIRFDPNTGYYFTFDGRELGPFDTREEAEQIEREMSAGREMYRD